MAKRCATTKISRTPSPGNTGATARSPRRSCIASRSCLKPSNLLREATNELQAQGLAAERSEDERQARRISGHGRFPEHVVPRNARCRERRANRERRGADRVRFRLPGRNLRDVFIDDQRRSAWARSSRRGLRSLYAAV